MNIHRRYIFASGGLDSFAGSLLYGDAVPVFVRTGLRYEDRDLGAARALFGDRLRVIENTVPYPAKVDDAHVHWRNFGLLKSLLDYLSPLCQGSLDGIEVLFSCPKGGITRDTTPAFLRALECVAASSTFSDLRVRNSVAGRTKTDLLRLVREVAPYSETDVRSCYADNTYACGRCVACCNRFVAERTLARERFATPDAISGMSPYDEDPRPYLRAIVATRGWVDRWRMGASWYLDVVRACR